MIGAAGHVLHELVVAKKISYANQVRLVRDVDADANGTHVAAAPAVRCTSSSDGDAVLITASHLLDVFQ